ncbi:MAG TPA: L-serine ammonia-lyase, iron-sulfur-dependent, subunit alpha [Bacillota bacterium]|jgi:L-cysteine desulfidase|nr:L-serine ammonia-lyase, iron-sulfur-dependent, subunit alpha [Bacillota bacterium]
MLTLKEFLAKEVVPALGCTEPGAVALATARAREELGAEQVERISVRVSDSIYKNGMNVGVPGASGETGNALAAALGALAGKADLSLEVLRDCTPAHVSIAKSMLGEGRVEVVCLPDVHGVFVEATVKSASGTATCVIEGEHTNIVSVSVDGKAIFRKGRREHGQCHGRGQDQDQDQTAEEGEGTAVGECGIDDSDIGDRDIMDGVRYQDLLELADHMAPEEIDYVMRGVDMNKSIAEYGLASESLSGLGAGKAIWALMSDNKIEKNLSFLIRSYSSAASDARMAGAQLPTMSAAGSGNQGITAIIPVALVGESMGLPREAIARGVTVSLLSTSFVRSRIGRLTPVCGCSVAAGAGAAAGIAVLLGGNWVHAARAMQIVLSSTAGIVCDGAKGTCALRVGAAACEAYLAALIAVNDRGINSAQGIVDDTIEGTADNVGRLNAEGMRDVDRVLINIIEERVRRSEMM